MYAIAQTVLDLVITIAPSFPFTALDPDRAVWRFSLTPVPFCHGRILYIIDKESAMKISHECRQQKFLRNVLAMMCLSVMALLVGCDQQGSTDKAEQQVERAADTAEQKIDQAKDQAEKEIDAAKESVTDTTRAAGDAVDDAAITTKIKSAILTDPLLSGSRIEVTTVNGVVTLRGTVNEEPDIARAIEVANTQRGVKGVQSELVVQLGQ